MPEERPLVMGIEMSGLPPVLGNPITQLDNTFALLFVIINHVDLLIRFQDDRNVTHVWTTTITARWYTFHHTVITGMVHEYTAKRRRHTSIQMIHMNTQLTNETNLIDRLFLGSKPAQTTTTSQRYDVQLRVANKRLSYMRISVTNQNPVPISCDLQGPMA